MTEKRELSTVGLLHRWPPNARRRPQAMTRKASPPSCDDETSLLRPLSQGRLTPMPSLLLSVSLLPF
ncbi:hypothetical protein RIF29_09011 [Crotalaria pallida]|uniref:Uncharacterized protein n=1 Tax=Crotalaria pallida TaxID=3830 RepID=A0AAN9FU99_CROPI